MRLAIDWKSATARTLHRIIAFTLTISLLSHTAAFAAGRLPDAEQIHRVLKAHGIGKRVKITETDGTTVTGILTGLRDQDFDVTLKDGMQPIAFPYAQVAKVQRAAGTIGWKVTKGAIIGLIVAGGIMALIVAHKEDTCPYSQEGEAMAKCDSL